MVISVTRIKNLKEEIKMKISKRILSMILTVGVIAGSSVTALATNNVATADKLEDSTAVVESKDESRAVSLSDEEFITVSDEFRALVQEGKVDPISATTVGAGNTVTTVDQDGVAEELNLEISTYGYCDHSTKDVYIYVHKKSGSSCHYEKWNGVKCTKCGTSWKMDMLSDTYYQNCPH